MLVVTSKQMSEIEKKAFEEGCSDEAFMVLAGSNIAKTIKKSAKNRKILLLCGKGNNGGDAYVAGSILLKENFCVEAYYFSKPEDSSKLNQKYFKEFRASGGDTHLIKNINDLLLPNDAILVDGLLGTGFKGGLKDPYLSVVKKVNSSSSEVFSIDIPSGLNGTDGSVISEAVKADTTIYLGMLKSGFFLNEGPNFTGSLVHADFGLPKEYIDQIDPFANYFQNTDVRLPVVCAKRHKYDVGYVVGVAGSYGMFGAAILSSFAALKAGAGIVRLYSLGDISETESKPLEVIHQWLSEDSLPEFFKEVKRAKAVFMGPGMGRSDESQSLFFRVLEKLDIPVVLDADALFFLAKSPEIELLQDTILTPHRGEMLKILNEKKLDDVELIEKTIAYAKKKRVIVVLKGAPTIIVHYEKTPFIISSGTPALATAGTGDVLTGIIAAQIAQGVEQFQAAAQAAFLHGLSAQIAENKTSTYALVASDVIENLSRAFKKIEDISDKKKTNL